MKKQIQRASVFLMAFFIIISFLSVSGASALSLGGVGIKPINKGSNRDWFIYNLGPGESVEDYAVLYNESDEEVEVIVRAYDSEPSNIGAFALTGQHQEQKGIGKWVELEETEATLAPKERRVVKFTLTIPDGADVGEHSGAITIQTKVPRIIQGMTGAAINTRVGARVYNTVPGDIVKSAEIISLLLEENQKKNKYNIILTARNNGNVSLSPNAVVKIGGWGLVTRGEMFYPFEFKKEWQLLRGTQVSTNWEWEKPYFGKYSVQAELSYEKIKGSVETVSSETLEKWVIPWRDAGIVGGALLFLVLILAGILVRKKIKYSGKGWDSYTVRANDNIISIAQKCGVSWKTIAKVNRVKRPYFLSDGQKILVPPGRGKKMDAESPQKKSKKARGAHAGGAATPNDGMRRLLIALIIVLCVIVLGLGALVFYQSIQPPEKIEVEKTSGLVGKESPWKATNEPAVQYVPQAEEPEEEAVDPTEAYRMLKESVSIRVLNGSGIEGLAGKMADELRASGYANVDTDNAESYDYTGLTVVYYQAEYQELAHEIRRIFDDEYEDAVIEESNSDEEIGIVLILGKK